jgi:hypothetical protein
MYLRIGPLLLLLLNFRLSKSGFPISWRIGPLLLLLVDFRLSKSGYPMRAGGLALSFSYWLILAVKIRISNELEAWPPPSLIG